MSHPNPGEPSEEVKELWDLQLKLGQYIVEDETELDAAVNNILPEHPPWLTNKMVFGPLFSSYEEDTEELLQKIRRKQNLTLEIINQRKETKKREIPDAPKKISALQSEISQLNQEINAIEPSSASGDERSEIIHKLRAIEEEIANSAEILSQTQREADEVEDLLSKCMEYYETSTNEYQTLHAQLKQTTLSYKQYRSSLAEMEDFVKQIVNHRNLLHQREQQLVTIISKLESTKLQDDKAIKRLDDSLSEHKQLVESYKLLEDRITKQEKQLDVAFNKLTDAVELLEDASADAKKQRMTRDLLNKELNRVRELTKDTNRRFDEGINEEEKLIAHHFTSTLEAIERRTQTLDQEKSQKTLEKESVEKQIGSATQESLLLQSRRGENRFGEFVEKLTSMKAEVESCLAHKESIEVGMFEMKQNLEEIKQRLPISNQKAKEDQISLQKRSQQLLLEVELQRASFKWISSRNSKIASENQGIQSELAQAKLNFSSELAEQIKAKENEITNAQKKIDSTEAEEEKNIEEVKQTIFNYREHSEKWKEKARSIDSDADHQCEKIDGQIIGIQNQIERVAGEMRERKERIAKYSIDLEKLSQQISETKEKISQKERKRKLQVAKIEGLRQTNEMPSLDNKA